RITLDLVAVRHQSSASSQRWYTGFSVYGFCRNHSVRAATVGCSRLCRAAKPFGSGDLTRRIPMVRDLRSIEYEAVPQTVFGGAFLRTSICLEIGGGCMTSSASILKKNWPRAAETVWLIRGASPLDFPSKRT